MDTYLFDQIIECKSGQLSVLRITPPLLLAAWRITPPLLRYGEAVQHYKVLRDGEGKYFLWVMKFPSLNTLIEYHKTQVIAPSQSYYHVFTLLLRKVIIMCLHCSFAKL